MAQRRPQSDFDPEDFTQKTDEHTRSIGELQAQIQQLVQVVQPIVDKENFSLYFRETVDSHIALNNAIAAVLKKLLLENPEIRSLITTEVRNSDRDWLSAFMRRIGWVIGAIFLALISGLAGFWIHH